MIPSVIRCKVHSGAPAAVSMNETEGIIRFLKNIYIILLKNLLTEPNVIVNIKNIIKKNIG